MRKSLTYATIAVLLGVALMLTPLSLFVTFFESKKGAEPYSEQPLSESFTKTFKESSLGSERRAGITPHYPWDAISVGLMLTFSLIFASIIFSVAKKKAT